MKEPTQILTPLVHCSGIAGQSTFLHNTNLIELRGSSYTPFQATGCRLFA